MAQQQMTLYQAARWADRNDAVYFPMRDGSVEWNYAVHDMRTGFVLCIGKYDKCSAFLASVPSGSYWRMDSLESVLEQIDEEEGEASCIPDISEQREWM